MAILNSIFSTQGGVTVARFSGDSDDIIIGDSDTSFSADSDNNISIGINALGTATTSDADNNIAIGTSVLAALTQGDTNISIGYESGLLLTSGGGNVILGYGALSGSTGASSNNVAIGYQSMYASDNNSCEFNVVLGYRALRGGSGDNNIYIGNSSGYSLSNAADNVVSIGRQTCQGALTAAADGTIAVGAYALGALTSGGSNTALGYQAGNILTTGSGNTLLGYDVDVEVNSQSNTTVIGNGSVFKFISKSVTCDQGGTDENDPAHTVAIGKIPRYAVITRATAVLVTKNSQADHSLKLVLSSDSSGTDNTVLNDVQELLGAGASNSWSATGAAGAAADINCATGAVEKTAYASIPYDPAGATDSGLATLDTVTEDTYVYLAFANATFTGSDAAPSVSPVVNVMVEYAGLD